MSKKILRNFIVVLGVFGITACASNSEVAPNDLAVKAETLLEQANSKDVKGKAAEVYVSAKENFEAATDAMKQEEYVRARQLFERSVVDSEYAIALAESRQAQESEEQVERTLNTLENQL